MKTYWAPPPGCHSFTISIVSGRSLREDITAFHHENPKTLPFAPTPYAKVLLAISGQSFTNENLTSSSRYFIPVDGYTLNCLSIQNHQYYKVHHLPTSGNLEARKERMISNAIAIFLLALTLIICLIVLLCLLRLRRHRRKTLQQRRQNRCPTIPLKPTTPASTSTSTNSTPQRPLGSSFDKDLELGSLAQEISIGNNARPATAPPQRPRPTHLNLQPSAESERTSHHGLKELEAGFDLSSSLPPRSNQSPKPPRKSPRSPMGSPLLGPSDADGVGRRSWRLSMMSAMSGKSASGQERRKNRLSGLFGGRRTKDREEVRLTYFAW